MSPLNTQTQENEGSGRMQSALAWMYKNWLHWPEILTEARSDRRALKKVTDRLTNVIIDDTTDAKDEQLLQVRTGPQGKADIAELDDSRSLLKTIAKKHQAIDKQFPDPESNPVNAAKREKFWLKQGKSSYVEAKKHLAKILTRLKEADYWGEEAGIQERAQDLEGRLTLTIREESEPETLSSHEDVESIVDDLAALENDMKILRRTQNVAGRYLHTLEDFEKIVRDRLMNRSFWRSHDLVEGGKKTVAEQAEAILKEFRKAVRPSNPGENPNKVGIDIEEVTKLRNTLLELTDTVYNQINKYRVTKPSNEISNSITSEGLHQEVLLLPRIITTTARDAIEALFSNRTIKSRTEILPYKAKRMVKRGLEKVQPMAKKIGKKMDVAKVAAKDNAMEGSKKTVEAGKKAVETAKNAGKRVGKVSNEVVQKLRNIAF